jgi:tetratricopeptide (TPR) repeat protein
MPEIGRLLGVTSILEGGVQRAGDSIRINVQLIDVATDSHQWAEIYDRQFTASNIFLIQSEIANGIAIELRMTLWPAEKSRIASIPTDNLEAYESYLLGNTRLKRRTGAAIEDAVEFFSDAVTLDPDFALAYVGLADSYQLMRIYTNRQPEEVLPLALASAERAIELDPNLGEAYASLAEIHYRLGYVEDAEPLFLRALALSPYYATADQWYGEFLRGAVFRYNEALEHLLMAVAIDPLSPVVNRELGISYNAVGKYSEGEARIRRSIEIDPDFVAGYGALAGMYFRNLGRL